jgi:hypothetical protein
MQVRVSSMKICVDSDFDPDGETNYSCRLAGNGFSGKFLMPRWDADAR